MKANELKLNNYILLRGNLCQIVSISGLISESVSAVMIDKHGEKRHLYGEMKDIEGIKLTSEILLNQGFTRDTEIDYRYYLDNISIAIDIDDFGLRLSDSWEYNKILYIHQLQNLYFALTGQELTINLQ